MDTATDAISNGLTNNDETAPINTSSVMSKTTTISTIAVQSGKTRLVIALLHCGDWLQLKILDVAPELTKLGNTREEAFELQQAHDEVLRQLQNKQSPVEELLRQADQLISTQKPRAEVYAAMAESLGRAWKDINAHLELRKQILDLNVQYHTKAQEFFDTLNALQNACRDTDVPIDVEVIKKYLTTIHEYRKTLLENLMGALQTGNLILGKLRELGAEGTLDSRPDRIRCSVNRAITQVQSWLEELHARRQVLEVTFNTRKSQLEQCLALAILAVDLKEVEDALQLGLDSISNTNELGNSESSAELLLHEHKKLVPPAKVLQERALKITKATEQLVEYGCFGGAIATQQAYQVLAGTSDYLNKIDNRSSLLERVIAFFNSANDAFVKLNQVEHQINATDLTRVEIAKLHEKCSETIDEITIGPLNEGYSILNSVGRGKMESLGVQKTVEELENRKISLQSSCTAHHEENLRMNKALTAFLEQHTLLYSWLISAAETFLQGHQDMGSDLPSAKHFWDLHSSLLMDLQTKGNEINTLLLTLPPVLEFLNDNQRRDVDSKVEELHELWLKLKNILELRLDLSGIFVKFHTEANYVNNEMDKLSDVLRFSSGDISDENMRNLEEAWESLVPLYQSAKNTGVTFINTANKVPESYLDTKRACACVESVLEKLAGRQLVITRDWQTFQTTVVEKKELLVELEIIMVENTKALNWTTKLDTQLYPVITTDSENPLEIVTHLEQKLETTLTEIKRAHNEVEERVKATDGLLTKTNYTNEQLYNMKNKLMQLNQTLVKISTDYKILVQMMMSYFNNIKELDKAVKSVNNKFNMTALPSKVYEVEVLIREHETSKQAVLQMFGYIQNDCEKLAIQITNTEPNAPAKHDIEKLHHSLRIQRDKFYEECNKRRDNLDAHKQLCQFDSDLGTINNTIDDLTQQLTEVKGQFCENLSAAKAASQAYGYFEKTVEMLGQRIETFIQETGALLDDQNVHSAHIDAQIKNLKERWSNLLKQVDETRRLINLSIQYFELVEEANEWFRRGSQILVAIARRSTQVKHPQEAEQLLKEIEQFLKPGEIKQNERIDKIFELANQLYGQELHVKSSQVVTDNKEMLESFASITQELQALMKNLKPLEEKEIIYGSAVLNSSRPVVTVVEKGVPSKITSTSSEENKTVTEVITVTQETELVTIIPSTIEKQTVVTSVISQPPTETKMPEIVKIIPITKEAQVSVSESQKPSSAVVNKEITEIVTVTKTYEPVTVTTTTIEKQTPKVAVVGEEENQTSQVTDIITVTKEFTPVTVVTTTVDEEVPSSPVVSKVVSLIREEKPKSPTPIITQEEIQSATKIITVTQEKGPVIITSTTFSRVPTNAVITEIASIPYETKTEIQNVTKPPEPITVISTVVKKQSPIRAVVSEERESELVSVTNESATTKSESPLVFSSEELSHAEESDNEIVAIETQPIATITTPEVVAPNPNLNEEVVETVEITQVTKEVHVLSRPTLESVPTVAVVKPPVFVSLLNDAVIEEGSKFSFECRVIGEPTPEISWLKDGMSIQNNPDYNTSFNNGLCTLKIEETFAEDSARYTCKAVNSAGSAENGAFLTVQEVHPSEQLIPPNFILRLSPVTVQQGQQFQLQCKVEGNPLPTVQWYKNEECIDNSADYAITYNNGDAVLKYVEGNLEDKFQISCKASNQIGTAQSTTTINVEPLEKTEYPIFVTPLSNVMARAGQKIKLECEVSGVPTPSLTWLHDGKLVKETNELKIQTLDNQAILVISEAFPKNGGVYVVKANNKAGEASSECTVTVKGRLPTENSDSEAASDMEPIKPSIQSPLKDLILPENSQVCLDCVIVGQPEPEVIWYHDERPVKESADIQLLFQGDRCSLIVKSALPEDSGNYKVVALNSAGEASSKCKLTVSPSKAAPLEKPPPVTKFTPKFGKLLADALVSEGEKVTFETTITGEPRPTIKWFLNNQEIIADDNVSFSYDNEGTIKLEIAKVTPDQRGVYTVKATNDVGDAKCFAQLIVKSLKPSDSQKEFEEVKTAPVFKELFADKTVFNDVPTKFECIVAGKPTPKVKWLFNNEPVTGKGFLISTSGDRQVLSIPQAQLEHNGKFSCIAENDAGRAECAARLTVQAATTLAVFEPNQNLQGNSFYTSQKEVVMQSTTSSSSQVRTSSSANEPQVEVRGYISQDSQTVKQINQEKPEVKEVHMLEKFHKIGEKPIVEEKSISSFSTMDETKPQVPILTVNRTVRTRPPKFMTPVIGKIVDQGVDVILEGIIDGQPTPNISWEKNGVEIKSGERLQVLFDHNRVQVEIKNVSTGDGGRYTCKAINDAGTAISTADLVVRKTTFPPVFGRRLQAQVVKKGDRVHMDVEVTGIPTPTVKWLKDDKPIDEVLKSGYKITNQGNSYSLLIEKVDSSHTGKYMVKASNDGGEAQSIADFAVFEPTPDTMIEVVKTVVFEDIHKQETLAAEHSKESFTIPEKVIKPELITPFINKLPELFPIIKQSEPKSLKTEAVESSHSTVTKTETLLESKVVKLESNTSSFPSFSSTNFTQPKTTAIPIVYESSNLVNQLSQVTEALKPIEIPNDGIETSSISKQSSLNFFVKKMNETEEPKEIPKRVPLQAEIYTKFEDSSQKTEHVSTSQSKIADQERLDRLAEIYKPHEPLLIPETYTPYVAPPPLSFSTDGFDLKPEPPPEILYAPHSHISNDTQKFSKTFQNFESSQYTSKREVTQPYTLAPQQPIRAASPKPSFEALEMEKLWTPHREPEKVRPVSAQQTYSTVEKSYHRPTSAISEPSSEALAMEKNWAHKFSESHVQSKPTTHESKSWSAQTTLERKWEPIKEKPICVPKSESIFKPAPPAPFYVATVTDLHEKQFAQQAYSEIQKTELHEKSIVEDSSTKVSDVIRNWPPPSVVEKVETYQPPVEEDETFYSAPEPIAELHYVEPPQEIKSTVADTIQKFSQEETSSHYIKQVAPPLPPKQEKPLAPPVPIRQPVTMRSETIVQTPTKFMRGRFTDSDYESEFESTRIPAKWKPSCSDTEEPQYRRVCPPKVAPHVARSRSVEPEPLPPSKFAQSNISTQSYKSNQIFGPRKMVGTQPSQFKKCYSIKSEPVQPQVPYLKPEPPPVYLKTDSKFKSESIKSKAKPYNMDGYMADTDEPFTLRKNMVKSEYNEESIEESYTSSSFTSESFHKSNNTTENRFAPKTAPLKVFKKHVPSSNASKKELVATPIISSVTTTKKVYQDDRESSLEPFPYKQDQAKSKHARGPPPPSPSKFIKGEFRESDYESDYDGRISSVWRSNAAPCYKPVRPILTPSGRHSQASVRTPTPPTEFDKPPNFNGPPRPKFEPIEKPKAKINEVVNETTSYKQTVHKPKPITPKAAPVVKTTPIVLQPGSPPEIAFAPEPTFTQYYRSSTSAPHHNAVQTETSNVMHFKESTENSNRTVSLQQTKKIITFGNQQNQHFSSKSTAPVTNNFKKKEIRESDYDSEVELTKFKSWNSSENKNENHYHEIKAPQPIQPFDPCTALIKPGSPPEYGYIPEKVAKAAATKIASQHMNDMTHAFKSKTQQFVSDIMTDVNKKSTEKSIVEKSENKNVPQVYREDTRAAQYGTKHVDPDTGLIYFKYDFGYEFGVILPGQSKGGEIPVPHKTIIEPPKRTKDIEMPVYHETAKPKFNNSYLKPVMPNKTVKWEPTSESEMSEYESEEKKRNDLISPRWEPYSTSPTSVSPNLLSASPAFYTAGTSDRETPISGVSTPKSFGQSAGQSKHPPMFITPLRDIAAVSGETARFECIVQSEPLPTVLWSKNGRIIENSRDYQIFFRNGVCRLTIPQAYPEDAGTYTCTATNQNGGVGTTATLQVPGERRSQYLQ